MKKHKYLGTLGKAGGRPMSACLEMVVNSSFPIPGFITCVRVHVHFKATLTFPNGAFSRNSTLVSRVAFLLLEHEVKGASFFKRCEGATRGDRSTVIRCRRAWVWSSH